MKILLTHTPAALKNYYGERAYAGLRDCGDVQIHRGEAPLFAEDLIAAAQDVDIILSDRATAGCAAVFAALPKLKVFLRCAVDIRTIDVDAASAVGVLVTQASPGFIDSVVELTVGFLVDLARGISRTSAAYHAGAAAPEVRLGRQLAGSTIGIIGYGSIARRLAPVVSALGMTVLITDPHVIIGDPRFRQVPFDELLGASDHIVCLAVATPETENLIDARALALMKRDAVFINVSRGNLVDEAALAAALRDGRIAGAAMDVGRAPDQMPTPALAALPNVIATPHIGGLTRPAIEAQSLETVEQVRQLLRGEIPQGAVNAQHWSRRL